jgi:thymidine kinase
MVRDAMGVDIMEDWKNQRFVVAPSYLVDDFGEQFAILTDLDFWTKNVDELAAWCEANDCDAKGMTVAFKNSQSLTAFCLRWS